MRRISLKYRHIKSTEYREPLKMTIRGNKEMKREMTLQFYEKHPFNYD